MPTEAQSTRTWVLALTSVASLMVALELLVVSTALSTIRLDLDASIGQLQWTVSAYGLSFAVLLMTGAALGDRFGRRRVFTLAVPQRHRATPPQLVSAGLRQATG